MPSKPGIRSICSIAGSDSSAGAGIQADLKAAAAYRGCYCATVITAVTAQNTRGVQSAYQLPTDVVRDQIAAVFDDLQIGAVKTGMLGDAPMIETVADELSRRRPPWLVVDPVMISKTGFPLLADEAVASFSRLILPLADVLTPNTHEAERLTGIAVRTLDDAERAGQQLRDRGATWVLVKGGHLESAPATDLLVGPDGSHPIAGKWIDTPHTHGTGCTYAAAIAARLSHDRFHDDQNPTAAIADAKRWLTGAIRHGLPVGHGVGPTNPFWQTGAPSK